MHRSLKVAALAAATAVLVALPATAGARTQIVWAGGPAKFQTTLQHKYSAEALDFFPHSVAIHVGDTITWKGMSTGFHTVDIPIKGGEDLPLILAGKTISGVNDAAGNPFWFNGQANAIFNPKLFKEIGTHVYNGHKRLDTGLPLGPPKSFKVKFTKPGTYVYFCDVHYDMRGVIVVRPQSRKVPTRRQIAASVAKQVKRDTRVAKGLHSAQVPANTVHVGQAGKDNVEALAMFPNTLHVAKGTTVTFTMTRLTGETHTATFGPAAYLKPLQDSFAGPAPDPRAVYQSDAPPGAITVSPTSHGNGFASTGALDEDKSTPLKPGAKVTFDTPGTYQYECLIHPFMKGTIIVS